MSGLLRPHENLKDNNLGCRGPSCIWKRLGGVLVRKPFWEMFSVATDAGRLPGQSIQEILKPEIYWEDFDTASTCPTQICHKAGCIRF